MTRREVTARFRKVVERVLAAPDPVLIALHEKGLGPKPEPYRWNAPAKKGRSRNGNGTSAAVEDAAKEAL